MTTRRAPGPDPWRADYRSLVGRPVTRRAVRAVAWGCLAATVGSACASSENAVDDPRSSGFVDPTEEVITTGATERVNFQTQAAALCATRGSEPGTQQPLIAELRALEVAPQDRDEFVRALDLWLAWEDAVARYGSVGAAEPAAGQGAFEASRIMRSISPPCGIRIPSGD